MLRPFRVVMDNQNKGDMPGLQPLFRVSPWTNREEAMMETAKTMSVPEAGRRYFNIGKNASYDAVKRGEIPVIKIGSRLRVPISALDRMLEQAGAPKTTSAR